MAGLREALEETYDEIDNAEEVAPAVEPEPIPELDNPEALEAQPDRARDESGKFVKETKPAAQDKPPLASAASPAKPAAVGQGAAVGAVAPAAAPTATPAFKFPQSWKAQVRELASKLPAEFHPIIEESLRREKETTLALQSKADAEKAAQSFQEVVRPYEAQIRAAGQQPHQYVGTLLQTAHSLFYGPPGNKPGMLADLIVQSGVPPEALDQALVARMNGQRPAPVQQPQSFQDPRVDQLMRQLEDAKKERTTAVAAEMDSTATSFAESHEFFDDVGEEMANVLDVWAKAGKKDITDADIEKAYSLACNLNEDVSKTLEGRKAGLAAQTAQAVTVRARAASSSVRSQPTAAPAAQPAGRRAVLEEKYDELDQ